MKLIVDNGSTKASWALIDDGNESLQFVTEGFNPLLVTSEFVVELLQNQFPAQIKEKSGDIDQTFFYSAGAGYSSESDNMILVTLSSFFPNSEIIIETDLVGAAKSLLQHNKGMAFILGTGSNSCIYDGEKIIQNIDSLGFILGDEGSGAYIGKRFIKDYIRGTAMPSSVKDDFYNFYNKSTNELIHQIYTKPFANKYCASICTYIGNNINKHSYFKELIAACFDDMFENIIIHYSGYKDYSLNCVGSIAWHFRSVLTQTADKYGMKTGLIMKEPMPGLIRYHSRSNQN